MPILQAFGPSAGRAPLPPPIAGATAAARRYGVLPMPSLEWNAQVERETAHLYDARQGRRCRRSSGRSSRPM